MQHFPQIANETDLSRTCGVFIPTRHLRGKSDSYASLQFSPQDSFLAQILLSHGAADVWNCATGARLFRFRQPGISAIMFSPDEQRLATYGELGGTIWDIKTQATCCHLDWSAYNFGPSPHALFDPGDGSFVVASGIHVLRYDTKSANLLEAKLLPNSASERGENSICSLNQYGQGVAAKTIYTHTESTPTVEICLFSAIGPVQSHVFPLPPHLSLLSAQDHLAILRNNHSSMIEVWDLAQERMLLSFPHVTLLSTFQFGPGNHWLAYAYGNPGEKHQSDCFLQIWDIQTGRCLHDFEGTASWHILWSQQSGLMAMFNLSRSEQKPKRNLTLLINPFVGGILAHTYGHSGVDRAAYRISPSGRYMASIFASDYLSNEGAAVPSGTIAITDLSSISVRLPSE